MRQNRDRSLLWLCRPVVALLLTIFATMWLSAMQRSKSHFDRALELEAQGEVQRAASHYQWAARAYAPFTSTGDQSLERLWRLSVRALSADDKEESLRCLDLMRGVIWSTQWLLNPYSHWSDKVNREISILRGRDIGDVASLQRALIDDPRPSRERSFFLFLATLSLIISGGGLLYFGLDTQLKRTKDTYVYLAGVCGSAIFFWCVLSL